MTKISPNRSGRAFTLFEVVLSLAILMLIAGAIFSLSSAALEATRSTRADHLRYRRVEAFLRATREAFLGLDSGGRVFLRFEPGGATPELVFERMAGAFGIASLAGGSLVLSAPPQADGSRAFSLRRLPKEDGRPVPDISRVPLLPGVERVRWTFFAKGSWTEEWKPGAGRPELVGLSFACREMAEPSVEAVFWIPPLAESASPPAQKTTPPSAP